MGSGIGDCFNKTTDDLTGGNFGLDDGSFEVGDEDRDAAEDYDEAGVAVRAAETPKEIPVDFQSVKNFVQSVNRIRFNSLTGW